MLEWVPKGSMQDLLESAAASVSASASASASSAASSSRESAIAAAADSASSSSSSPLPSPSSSAGLPSLRWEDPLLKLASDVARGMTYLHGRHYFDEQVNKRSEEPGSPSSPSSSPRSSLTYTIMKRCM